MKLDAIIKVAGLSSVRSGLKRLTRRIKKLDNDNISGQEMRRKLLLIKDKPSVNNVISVTTNANGYHKTPSIRKTGRNFFKTLENTIDKKPLSLVEKQKFYNL